MRTIMATYGHLLLKAIGVHMFYVTVSVVCGFFIGLIGGILLSRIPRASFVILPVVSVFQTIPGLAFIGILFLIIGMHPVTVLIALTVYAIFPVLKNTYEGILNIDPKYIEAARGCGMTSGQMLRMVQLPLASPEIVAGLRMAAVYTVSWAVLAAMIGLGGLGDFIYQGTASNNNTLILLGAVPAALLAIAIGAVIDLLQKKLTPKGMQEVVDR